MSEMHAKIAASHAKLQRGQVWCRTCEDTYVISAAHALRHGWPKCCGFTMTIDAPSERASHLGSESP